jgi:iron(III) transport system permease protein
MQDRLTGAGTQSRVLALIALSVGALSALPLAYVAARAAGADAALWSRLWSVQIGALLRNTVALVLSTSVFSTVFGVGLAWLVERAGPPGRSFWRLALALPLGMPAYVTAISYIIVFRRGGVAQQVWAALGFDPASVPLPDIYSLGGATLAIGLSLYPYVFLPVAARLRSTSRSLDEAARINGAGPLETLWRVHVPLLLPAMASGALLIALYTLSDFGTVTMLRYRTFTQSIYSQFAGSVDRSAAAALSMVLVGLTAPLLILESRLARGDRRRSATNAQGGGQWRPAERVLADRQPRLLRLFATLALASVVLIALVFPVGVLAALAGQALLAPTAVDVIWSQSAADTARHAFNSAALAAVTATLAGLMALAPAALVTQSRRTRLAALVSALCKAPYALPGVIIGLAFVMLFSTYWPAMHSTVVALATGMMLRLLPQAVTLGRVALASVPRALPAAARVMGSSPMHAFMRVTLPIAAPATAANWALLFLVAIKELPTVLMLRPPGFDTLAVRIWAAASESVYTQAALPAFVLVMLTMLLLGVVYPRHLGLDAVGQ